MPFVVGCANALCVRPAPQTGFRGLTGHEKEVDQQSVYAAAHVLTARPAAEPALHAETRLGHHVLLCLPTARR